MFTKINRALHSTRAAIDLASILVGVIVIGIIGGVIAATIFAVIPWTQDNAAKGTLDSMKTAQSAYQGFTDGDAFANKATLADPGAAVGGGKSLFKAGSNFDVVTGVSDDCYVAVIKSDSGNIFYITEKMAEAKQYDPNNPVTTACTPIGPIVGGIGGEVVNAEWEIPDANLRQAVLSALGQDSDHQLMLDEAPLLTSLSGHGIGVSDLTGLEYATNLKTLWLNNSEITDLTPISNLPITNLNMSYNKIVSIDALQGMPVTRLDLTGNRITDLTPLAGGSTVVLYLGGNAQLTDLSALANMDTLDELSLVFTGVTDLAPLAQAHNLRILDIRYLNIADYSPVDHVQYVDK